MENMTYDIPLTPSLPIKFYCFFVGLKCKKSALFRHEVAFILGQMQHVAAFDGLLERLADTSENPMVS